MLVGVCPLKNVHGKTLVDVLQGVVHAMVMMTDSSDVGDDE